MVGCRHASSPYSYVNQAIWHHQLRSVSWDLVSVTKGKTGWNCRARSTRRIGTCGRINWASSSSSGACWHCRTYSCVDWTNSLRNTPTDWEKSHTRHSSTNQDTSGGSRGYQGSRGPHLHLPPLSRKCIFKPSRTRPPPLYQGTGSALGYRAVKNVGTLL